MGEQEKDETRAKTKADIAYTNKGRGGALEWPRAAQKSKV